MTFRYLVATGAIVATAITAAAQPGMGRQRVDAFFKALASGDPDAFEAMAKEHYTPEMLARRTPADRRQMVERIKADFGQLTLGEVNRRKDGPVTLGVRGATGMQGTIELTLEPPPAERIISRGHRGRRRRSARRRAAAARRARDDDARRTVPEPGRLSGADGRLRRLQRRRPGRQGRDAACTRRPWDWPIATARRPTRSRPDSASARSTRSSRRPPSRSSCLRAG